MTKRRHPRQRLWLRRLRAVVAQAVCQLLVRWRALRGESRTVRIEILVAEPAERRRLEREIRGAIRCLQRLPGPALRCEVGVLVQRIVPAGHQVAGSSLVGDRADGQPFALIRLAAQVDGTALATDEIVAVLSELWVGIAVEQLPTPATLVPVEVEPCATRPRALSQLPPDPLAPRTNGHAGPHDGPVGPTH